MALQVWLPLTKDLRQQGLASVTYTGTPVFKNTGKLSGKSLDLNTRISFNCSALANKTVFSIAFWAKVNSDTNLTSNWVDVIGLTDISSGGTNGQLRWETCYASGYESRGISGHDNGTYAITQYSATSGTTPVTVKNTWEHRVFTVSVTQCTEYVDGVQRATYGVNGGHLSGAFWLGETNKINGEIQDVRIYDHCLSPIEVKELAKGLVLHYPLNKQGWGQENFILESHKVTSGGNANGITRTYESDGSMKIVSTSGNGNYASLGFAQNSNTSVGNNMVVGDTYCISCDIKIETGTVIPTLFINSGNGYKQLKPVNGSIVSNKWIRVYYTSTWADPGTQYGNISLHLGFSSAIGTYYFKNFKLEKGSIPTPWCPNIADANNMGLNSTIEYDCSGYCNNGTWYGTHTNTSDTPKYAVSTTATGSGTTYLEGPVLPAEAKTVALWIKNTSKSSNGAIFNDKTSGLQIGLLNSLLYMNSAASTAGFTTTHWVNGEWNHVVAINNNGTRSLYVNGQAETQSGASNYYIHNADNCWVWNRSYNNSYPFTGSLCDLRVYATALSADDVKSLYQNCATIDPDGTIRGQIRS